MKTAALFPTSLLAVALLGLWPAGVSAQNDDGAIALARSVLKSDRQAVVAESLQLTAAEAEDFWFIYHQYRAEMDTIGDGFVRLVKEYAACYPTVPEDRARQLLKDFLALERKQTATRAKYLKKSAKVLSAEKNLRFAQIENRLDIAVKLRLASEIPLVPIEGRLRGEAVGTAAVAVGTPGGVFVQTCELKARVAAIDPAARRVTLVSPDGIRKTVKVAPEAVNFDQIRVGDDVKVVATEELAVTMAGAGEAADDAAAGVVALAPKGAKPGGVVAETTRVTATVTALDPAKRTATLRFEDGSTRTVAVRPDIDLARRKVGEKVVFRLTEMVGLTVTKP